MTNPGGVLALIPARAGSQGLPGKNTRPLGGKPLIGWTFEAARAAALIDHLVLSTDDAEAAALARDQGIAVIDRPPELAGAQASVVDAALHALDHTPGDWEHLVLLQPTSPLRLAADIDAGVCLCRDRAAPAVFSVSPMAKPAAFHGRLDGDRFQPFGEPGEPAILNGAVYVVGVETLRRDRSFRPDGALPLVMPPSRGIDVDTLMDFALCEGLMLYIQAGRSAELDTLRR